MGLIAELKRRNVFRMAGLYLVAAWLIIQVANNILPVFGTPPWVLKTLIITLAIGLLPVIALSWAFEFTPEGLKRDAEVEAGSTEARNTARRLNHLLIGVLVLAVTYFAVDKFIIGRPPESAAAAAVQKAAENQERPSIAVLPFDNRSAVAEDAFFVDGMHDDILTQLSKISGLKVISRTSVEKFRNTNLSMRQIAAQLGVKTILEGAVQRGGNRVRINMQLIDAETDAHLWAETYDRELSAENIFAIQSEVTAAITASLKTQLSPVEKARMADIPTKSLPAWEAYQLGNHRRAKRTSAALTEAEAYFSKAVDLDPDFLLAKVLLADTYLSQVWYSDKDRNTQFDKAQKLIDAVLKIQPSMPEALSTAGSIAVYRGETAAGEELLRRALVLRPGYVPAMHTLSDHLQSTGRSAEAREQIDRAITLDPLSAVLYGKRAAILEDAGDFQRARSDYRKALEIEPDFVNALLGLALLDAYAFRALDTAIPHAEAAAQRDGGNPMMHVSLAFVNMDLERYPEAMAVGEAMVKRFGPSFQCIPAQVALYQGRTDESRRRAVASNGESCAIYWLLRDGKNDAVIAAFRATRPELFDDVPLRGAYHAVAGQSLVAALNASGRDAEARTLALRLLDLLKDAKPLGAFGYGLTDVSLLAQLGRKEDALTRLEQTLDSGWQGPSWRFERDFNPALAPIRADPRFRAAFERLKKSVDAQRARLPATPATP